MPTPHVSKGTRVYLTSAKMFGEVVKTSMLGTDAVVVECDNGSLKVACGEKLLDEVVDLSSSKDGRGFVKALPVDIKMVGPKVLESFGVNEQTRAALFQKFLVLEESVQLEKATYWKDNKDDPVAMSNFLPELMTLLGEDTLFIQKKSAKLLNHLDEDTKSIMLTNMMTSTTEEERKTMIMEYTSIQNDKKKVLEFLQDLYELLLDNKTYIRMEFKKSLAQKRIFEIKSSPMIETFLVNASGSQLEDVVRKWRKRKYYRSKKGGRYALNVLKPE